MAIANPNVRLIVLLHCALFLSVAWHARAVQPNIVWIVAEDISPIIAPYGDTTAPTPALSELAREGVRYTNAFSTSGVCAPSRAALATGMYPTHIGANHMRTGPWVRSEVAPETIARYRDRMPAGVLPYEAIPPAPVRMLSEILRRNGYYASNMAKADHQFRAPPTAWDDSSAQAHWRNRPDAAQPFFAVFNIGVTHESQIWARPERPLLIPEDAELPIPPYLVDDAATRADYRRLYSNVIEMDRAVAGLIGELRDARLLDNTWVFFFGDHGGPMPRQKRLLYDSGLRVPLIIRPPGGRVPAEEDTESRLVSFVDFLATTLSLAGIDVPDWTQGVAFLGTADPGPRAHVYAAADRFDETTDAIRAVRDQRFKYLRNLRPDQGYYLPLRYREQMASMQSLLAGHEAGTLTDAQAQWFRESKPAEELFDTWSDPHELDNLVGDPEHARVLEVLRNEYELWAARIDDTGAGDEREYFESLWPAGRQPQTLPPVFAHLGDGRLRITSATEGASVGFRFGDETVWRPYVGPVLVPSGTRVAAVAHRIGYTRSRIRVLR